MLRAGYMQGIQPPWYGGRREGYLYIPTMVHTWPYYPGVHSLASLGTPSYLHAHSRCVYTEHAWRRLTALEHRVAERTVGEASLTVPHFYRRYCSSSLLLLTLMSARHVCAPWARLPINVGHSAHRCVPPSVTSAQQCAHLLLSPDPVVNGVAHIPRVYSLLITPFSSSHHVRTALRRWIAVIFLSRRGRIIGLYPRVHNIPNIPGYSGL